MKALRIRLQRKGRYKRPFYNIVVIFRKNRVQGACLDKIGVYDPGNKHKFFFIDLERLGGGVGKGATISNRVGVLIGKLSSSFLS